MAGSNVAATLGFNCIIDLVEEGGTSKQDEFEDNLGKSENICPEPEKKGSRRATSGSRLHH